MMQRAVRPCLMLAVAFVSGSCGSGSGHGLPGAQEAPRNGEQARAQQLPPSSSGRLLCTGKNDHGEIGDGNTERPLVFTDVTPVAR